MYQHATLYLTRPIDVAGVRGVLGDAVEVLADEDRLTALRGDGAEVRVSLMPAVEIAAHLEGLRGYVQARCAVLTPELAARVDDTRQVLGLVIEPGFRHGDGVWHWLAALARAGSGMIFLAGAFLDERSRPLAAPPGLALETTRGGDERRRTPPDGERILRRAWALAAVAERGFLEAGARPDADGALARLRAWIDVSGTRTELEPEERAAVDAPLGSLDRQQVVDCTWRSEGVAVLAWALGLADLPAHDEQADMETLATVLGFPPLAADAAGAPTPTPARRPAEELERAERRLLAIHWRVRELQVAPGPVDFVRFSQEAWFGAFDLFGIAVADRDLAVGGAPIARADDALLRITSSIAAERHHAIAWVCGDDPLYSAVVTST
ncbi:MAG TPA: DUF4272 domain-containing protein [Kofleriaceae bacterium]|nr:DUF4272 domain-containing protein [Kofleriaceae bacterium]